MKKQRPQGQLETQPHPQDDDPLDETLAPTLVDAVDHRQRRAERIRLRRLGMAFYALVTAVALLLVAAVALPFALPNLGAAAQPSDSATAEASLETAEASLETAENSAPAAEESPTAAPSPSDGQAPVESTHPGRTASGDLGPWTPGPGSTPVVGGPLGWGEMYIYISPTMRADKTGWVSFGRPPAPVHCSFQVTAGNEVLATNPTFGIPAGGGDQKFLNVRNTFAGTAYVDVTCYKDASPKSPRQWHVGPLTVMPTPVWALVITVDSHLGEFTLRYQASLDATCDLSFTLPPDSVFGRQVAISSRVEMMEGYRGIMSGSVTDRTLPGAATYVFKCVDALNASHTDAGSFQVFPLSASPTLTPEPTAAPTTSPTAAPTPNPTAAPTPNPTATPTPKPTATPTPKPTATPTPTP